MASIFGFRTRSADRSEKFLHGRALAGAKIEGNAASVVQQMVDGPGVRFRQIHHMYEIAHATAVARVVVVAEDAETVATAEGRLDRQGNGVCFGIVPLADPSFRIGAGGIEIAQCHRAKPVVGTKIAKDLLRDEFASAVGIDRGLWVRLGHGRLLRDAVGGAGRRKDQATTVRGTRRREERERSSDVVLIERQRVLDGLSHLDQGGEMYDGRGRVFAENFVEPSAVTDIALFDRPPFDELAVTVAEIVIDDGRIALLGKVQAGVRADIAAATDDEDVAHICFS